MLRTYLRKISILLSIFNLRKIKINQNKHLIIQNYIFKKTLKLFSKNPRLRTHIKLSDEIMLLIKKKKLKNFLRNSLIQNIFFIHNRLFIYYELLELTRDKKWKFWKKLIYENDVGNPIRYFLYSESSGNRIRQVYILKKFLDTSKTINLKKIKHIIEIGGGYGCMADIFNKLNKTSSYSIYDMYEVNLIQYYYLKMNNHNPIFNNITNKLNLINDLKNLNKYKNFKKNYLFIANWSISEFPLKFRRKFISLIRNSKYSIISFQDNFEKIDNLKFFNDIIKKNNDKFNYNLKPFKYYNKSILNKNKHYLLTLIKK